AVLSGCGHTPYDLPDRGVAAVNVPVVTRSDFVFDAAAPDGSLAPGEAARLNAWFSGLDLGYGDAIYVDGPYAARSDVAQVAGYYGLMVAPSAPVTAGAVAPGTARVIVSRNRASVPYCPNWSVPAQPNHQNRTMSNFGCAVNSNLAAMVANPEDLVHGREGTGVGDSLTSSKAIGAYRKAEPTGSKGLQDISTTKKDD
ncbi:MAG TPA: CpaD family pilus assembly protein, partial [Sphingomicrobium sp.]|nr:CpaD family pilus assembly protein [Sphingomicrobium sp.]